MGPAACRQRTPRWPRPSRRSCRGMPWCPAPGSTTSSRTTAMHLPVCFHLGFFSISTHPRCSPSDQQKHYLHAKGTARARQELQQRSITLSVRRDARTTRYNTHKVKRCNFPTRPSAMKLEAMKARCRAIRPACVVCPENGFIHT